MSFQELSMGFQESAVFQLRSLFESYGFTQFKMNKFEEYDLYAKNKEFLLSESILTFTDFGGRLMALKPDVTLSIVKNSRDDADTLQKLYYNETVYRVDSGKHGFKEMQQVGLECIGKVDELAILEVLSLAAQSLRCISSDCVLDLSHLGILADALKVTGVEDAMQKTALTYIGEKNLHELSAFCRGLNISDENIQWLNQLLQFRGTPGTVLPQIREHISGRMDTESVDQLMCIFSALCGSDAEAVFRFDFSAVDDIRYYNGIVLKGYVSGVPSSVLSGGQYDPLMRKMHRKSGAAGFAVYIDRLEQLEPKRKAYDTDVVLLYDAASSLGAVAAQAESMRKQGLRVMVQQQKPAATRYKQLLRLKCGEVEILEDNA